MMSEQFEAELLTGSKIKTEQDALDAMMAIHKMGVRTVVLSSAEFGEDLVALASTMVDDERVIK